MIRHLKRLLWCSALLLTSLPGASGDETATQPVWVAILAACDGFGKPPREYCGSIEKRMLDGILATPRPTGFVKLSHVFWWEDGQMKQLSELSTDGVPEGYGSTAYFRAETIAFMIPLDEAFVRKTFKSPPAEPVDK